MRFPQIVVYEKDGRIAELLRREGKSRQWSIREPRRTESCLRLLERAGPSALVVKIGPDLLAEFTLLERASWLFPDTATVMVGDTVDPVLAGLAWDLGATIVLSPSQLRHALPEVLSRLLEPAQASPKATTLDEDAAHPLPDAED